MISACRAHCSLL